MEEGIRNANQAIKEFTEANKTDNRVHFETLRMKAENHRGLRAHDEYGATGGIQCSFRRIFNQY